MKKIHSDDNHFSDGAVRSEAEEANLEMQKPFKGETEQMHNQGVSPAFIYNPVVNAKND